MNEYNMLYNLMRSEQWLFIGEWIVCVYVCIYLKDILNLNGRRYVLLQKSEEWT